MNKITLIITWISLMASLSMHGQDLTVIESQDIDDNYANIATTKWNNGYISLASAFETADKIDENIYTLSVFNDRRYYTHISDSKNNYLMMTDVDLNFVEAAKLEFEDAKDVNVFNMIQYDGKIKLYYSKRQAFKKEIGIYVMDIYPDKLSRPRESKLYTLRFKNAIPSVRMLMSPDSSKICFITEREQGNKDEQKLHIAVYDAGGTLYWKDPVYFDKEHIKMQFCDAAMDNTGNVYISYKEYDKYRTDQTSKNKDGDKIPSYRTKIISYGMDETEIVTTLKSQGVYVRNCNIKYNPHLEKLQVCGTYSVKDGGNVTGMYHVNIDPVTFKSGELKLTPYDKELILMLDEDGFANKKDKDPGVEFRDMETTIIFKDDGSPVYVMQPYREERINRSFFAASGQWINNGWDIGYDVRSPIVAQIIDSTVIYSRIPRKMEDFRSLAYFMAIAVCHGDNVYLIYTDSRKSMERDEEEEAKRTDDPHAENLVLARILPDGTVSRNYIKNREEEKFRMSVDDIHPVTNTEYFYTAYIGGWFSSKRYIGLLKF